MEIIIPESVDNMQLPAPELITFYKNLENRTIWLDDEVDDCSIEFGRYIINWNCEDIMEPVEKRKPIRIMIMSPGGSLEVNNALIDIIKMSKTPIYSYNMGTAASAACFIFMACHKRFSMPNATFLLHKGSAEGMGGTFDQLSQSMDEYKRQIKELTDFIMAHSKIPKATLNKNLKGEWYVTAKKAYEDYGFVDAIVTDIDELY